MIDIERPNAAQETPRFADDQAFSQFLSALEEELNVTGWVSDGVAVTGHTTPN